MGLKLCFFVAFFICSIVYVVELHFTGKALRINRSTQILAVVHNDDSPQIVRYNFSTTEHVFVHVHIQKTAGSTFSKYLLSLKTQPLCLSKSGQDVLALGPSKPLPGSFYCLAHVEGKRHKDSFMISRYSSGWPCGVHSSFARLQLCAPKITSENKQLFYVTNLRDPVERLISEYFHATKGWGGNEHGSSSQYPLESDKFCNGTVRNFPRGCSLMAGGNFPLNKAMKETSFTGMEDREISLFDFLLCPATYKNNRQTKMLALNQKCVPEDGEEDQLYLLEQAKAALFELDFFGIAERLRESQLLFEFTFGVGFRIKAKGPGPSYKKLLKPAQVGMIKALESLDMELYEVALQVFEARIVKCGAFCVI